MAKRPTQEEMLTSACVGRYEPESSFFQGFSDFLGCVKDIADARSDYVDAGILDRLAEPDRIVGFRVVWVDDCG